MTQPTRTRSNSRERDTLRRIDNFRKKFGLAHLYFAYHAALPLALTPELFYQIRANFPQDINGKNLDIPWEA
jgi:hypothetical protein